MTTALNALFINENIGGHATVHHHLRSALVGHPRVEATFVDVPPAGLGRKLLGAPLPPLSRLDLDLQPLRAQLAHSSWVRRMLRDTIEQVDVVHLYTQNAGLLSADLLARVPTVVSLDTTNARNAFRLPYRTPTRFTPATVRITKRFEQLVFDSARRIIANSNWAAASLRSDYRIPDDKITVQPFGITAPPPRRRPAVGPGDADRPRIAFVGRQFGAKGGHDLLAAFAPLADRCELLVVTHEAVPQQPGVRVVNDLEPGDDRLWDLLASASVFAFPSPIDQAPNAVLEAMAVGLPVVGARSGAVEEMVMDGTTGILVDAGNAPMLSAALQRLIDDPSLRYSMGCAGQRRFVEHYDARATTEVLVDELFRAHAGSHP